MEHNSFDALKQRIEQMQSSPEYQANCQRFLQECTRLEEIAKELYARRADLQMQCEQNTVRQEYASGSTLHRGFYCPSPVFDLIAGNTHRGKLLKRITRASKPSHEYGFDADGRMLYCKTLHKEKVVYTEYLAYSENTVHSITLDPQGFVSCVTETVFDQDKPAHYLYGLCMHTENTMQCMELRCEYHDYDEEGLCHSQMHQLNTPLQNVPDFVPKKLLPFMGHPIYRGDQYRFERKDGFLAGYTNERGTFYPARFQRKA